MASRSQRMVQLALGSDGPTQPPDVSIPLTVADIQFPMSSKSLEPNESVSPPKNLNLLTRISSEETNNGDFCLNNGGLGSSCDKIDNILTVESDEIDTGKLLPTICNSRSHSNIITFDIDEIENADDDVRDPDFEYHSTSHEEGSTSEGEENEFNNIPQQEEAETVYKGRPKKGRKRKYKTQTDSTRKTLKNSNQQYVSKRGKQISKKLFVNYVCNCAEKCNEKMRIENRMHIFEKYWKLASYDLQTAFICSLVKEKKVNRKRTTTNTGNEKNRVFTRTYYLEDTVVCRDMFIKTIGISTKRVNTALTKARTLDFKDNRGRHTNHRSISEERKNAIIEQINRIPKYASHYRRQQTDRKYLPPHMTIEFMYSLYKSENANPASLSYYKHIFYTEFNITRKQLKKDTCNKCDAYASKISTSDPAEQQQLKIEHEQHLKAAEDARHKLKQDLQRAKDNANVETCTFDLEKTLPMPRIPTNVIFYKRQLWLYNLGIHSGKYNKGYCFVWPEGTAGRGAQEVGSCIRKFVEIFLEKNITDLYLWSDSCGGQNRNIKLCLMLKHLVNNHPTLERIHIRFLVSGHSFLLNDSDFGDIEKALKMQQRLYTPQDYINVIRNCRKKNPLIVTTMESTDFKSSATLEQMIVNRKKSTEGQKINWLQVREIKIEKDCPGSLFFKMSHNEDEQYTEVSIRPQVRSKDKRAFSLTFELDPLWPDGKPISTPKLNDIQSIMHLIPEVDQGFYTALIGADEIVDDIEGYDGDVDFEFEDELTE